MTNAEKATFTFMLNYTQEKSIGKIRVKRKTNKLKVW